MKAVEDSTICLLSSTIHFISNSPAVKSPQSNLHPLTNTIDSSLSRVWLLMLFQKRMPFYSILNLPHDAF